MDSFQEYGAYTVSDVDARVENWQRGFNKLEANDYTGEISKGILDVRGKIVTQMDFTNTTLFSNVSLIINNCPNLRKLSFHDVLLETGSESWDGGYQKPSNENSSIILPHLSTLTFGGNGTLSSSEIFLLEFLTAEVSTPALESVNFREVAYSRTAGCRASTPSENEDAKDDLLIKFLIKNAGSLKKLCIKRTPFSLIGNHRAETTEPTSPVVTNSESLPTGEKLISQLKSIQLNHLITYINCRGVENLVAHQENLELLFQDSSIPYSFQGIQIQKYMEAVKDCVLKSASSLAIVIAPGAIPTEEVEGEEEIIIHDLGIYKDCKSLMYLTLDKIYVGEGETIAGTFKNGGHLPTSLLQISLLVHHVEEDELIALIENLPNMTYLRDFQLQSATPYTITSESFKVLLNFSRTWQTSLRFLNGFLHSSIIPQELLTPTDDPTTLLPQWSVSVDRKGTVFFC